MKRVNTRTPRYLAVFAALLYCGMAQATIETPTSAPKGVAETPVASSINVVWNELKLGGDKSFNAYIQGNPSLDVDAGKDHASLAARPAPSLLWVLGAGIIGLATVARRRSH